MWNVFASMKDLRLLLINGTFLEIGACTGEST
jgi:hypothetical protein